MVFGAYRVAQCAVMVRKEGVRSTMVAIQLKDTIEQANSLFAPTGPKG